MNKLFIIGNLTKDPDLTTTSSGVSVCRFTMAVNRSRADANGERRADFFNVTAWRELGENVARYQRKGSKVAVVGTMQMRQYEDNAGIKRTVLDVIAEQVEFLTRSEQEPDDDSDIPF